MTAIQHHYPADGLRSDYLRAAAGTAICGLPLILTPVALIVGVVLAGMTLLFATYGVRTWLRRMETVVIDDTGITTGVLYRRNLAWRDISQLKLRYFSTRRDRSGGWMQLVLRGKGARLGIDSELEGFADVCRLARDAARANQLDLNETTVRNFLAVGLEATDMAPDSDVIVRSGTDGSGKKDSWGNPARWRR